MCISVPILADLITEGPSYKIHSFIHSTNTCLLKCQAISCLFVYPFNKSICWAHTVCSLQCTVVRLWEERNNSCPLRGQHLVEEVNRQIPTPGASDWNRGCSGIDIQLSLRRTTWLSPGKNPGDFHSLRIECAKRHRQRKQDTCRNWNSLRHSGIWRMSEQGVQDGDEGLHLTY